jgi:tetratricopeptide (TPR) repeat protein
MSSADLMSLIQTKYELLDLAAVLDLCGNMALRPDAVQDYHFWLGNAHLGLWHAARAEAEFRECLKLQVEVEGATLQLAKLFAIQGRRHEVEPLLWDLYTRGKPPPPSAQFDPGDRIMEPNLLVQLLIIQYFGWEAAAMIDQLRLFHEGDPSDFEAQLALARACFQTDRHAEAWELLQDCVAKRPDHPQANVAILECALATDNQQACREWLEKHPGDFSDVPEIWDLRGQIVLRDDDHDRAVDCFRKAIEINPYLPQSQYRLGRCLMKQGNRDEATIRIELGRRLNLSSAELLRTVAAMQSTQPTAPQCLGVARSCHELGRTKLAVAWLKLAKALGSGAEDVSKLQTEIDRNPGGMITGPVRGGK